MIRWREPPTAIWFRRPLNRYSAWHLVDPDRPFESWCHALRYGKPGDLIDFFTPEHPYCRTCVAGFRGREWRERKQRAKDRQQSMKLMRSIAGRSPLVNPTHATRRKWFESIAQLVRPPSGVKR